MSNNIRSHHQQDSSASRHEFTSPLIPRTLPLDPPSAGRSGLSSKRRFQLDADMRRESLAFFRKLDHGHADVSFDLLSNEWNEMINDPLIDHDADSPMQKTNSLRRSAQDRPASSYRRSNALNSTPTRPSIPLFKSSPFAASPKPKFEGDTDNDTSEFDTIGPPALSAGSLKALENLSPMQPPRARFDLQKETAEDRPSRVIIPSQPSSSFPPGSPSERNGRVIVAPTAPKTPERAKKPLSPIRFNRSSPNKHFPRSSLGTPRGFKSTVKPSSPRSQTSLDHYPDTPTRQPANIARTPARIHEYKPSDSQEEEQPLSPSKLDFEGVLADYNGAHTSENPDSSLHIPSSPAERASSHPSQQPASQTSNTYSSPVRLPNPSSRQTGLDDSPNRSIDEGVFLISATGQRQSTTNRDPSAPTNKPSSAETLDHETQGSTNNSDPATPQKSIRSEDPGSASSIRKVRDFWEKLSVSSAEKLASVTRSLDIWSPSRNKQPSNTSPLKRRISSDDGHEQRKMQRTTDPLKAAGISDMSSPVTSSNMLYSKLRSRTAQDRTTNLAEEGDDKENKAVAGDFGKTVSSLPTFKERNSPIARRRTEEFGKLVTPERSDMENTASKSVETQFTKRHLARNLVDELKSQPLPTLRHVSDRRTSRNLLDALASDDTTIEIVRKRNDFKQNFQKFEENIKQPEEPHRSPGGQDASTSRQDLDHYVSPLSGTAHTSPVVKKHSTDDDEWDVPHSSKHQQASEPTAGRSPARVTSKSPLRDRFNQFISPKRPTSHVVPDTPIPQTPKSAMLFAERKLTRGSGLDYASLPTPVRPTAGRYAAERRRPEPMPERRTKVEDENVLYRKPALHQPKVDERKPAALTPRNENTTVAPQADNDEAAATIHHKIDAVVAREDIPIEHTSIPSEAQKNTEMQPAATVEIKPRHDDTRQVDKWESTPKHSTTTIVEPVRSPQPKMDTAAPAMSHAAKRKREQEPVAERQRTKRKLNKIPPAQRLSRIPLAKWRIANMKN